MFQQCRKVKKNQYGNIIPYLYRIHTNIYLMYHLQYIYDIIHCNGCFYIERLIVVKIQKCKQIIYCVIFSMHIQICTS